MIRLTSLTVFAILGAAHSDATSILKNLQGIDAAANNLTSTTKAWDGSTIGASEIDTSANILIGLVDDANQNAADEGDASSDDSIQYVNYINATGEPDIRTSLEALIARKADLATAGATSNVYDAIESLKSKTDAYGTTLWAVTPTEQQSSVRAALAQLDSDFAKAIAAFS
jgi:hypothetical protein